MHMRTNRSRKIDLASDQLSMHFALALNLISDHNNFYYAHTKINLWQREKYQKLDHCQMTIMEAVKRLDLLVDESDPDVSD